MSRKGKLTDDQWLEIQDRFSKGEKQCDLATEFNVNQSQISQKLKRMANNSNSSVDSVPPELAESDEFLKAVKRLETKFPGAVQKIQAGFVKIKPAELVLNKY